ncbi:hypothetical protein BT93_D0578 [Corymbia citriodora subsp. variegata]|nr:hypothetical protein BT93_D0578 [Corymbia citriodora subsp. variegata]
MVLPVMTNFLVLVLLLVSCHLKFLICTDTINQAKFIRDPETITSKGGVFRLGFFSPLGSSNRYGGIWHNQVSVDPIIWVANRDRPLEDSSGTVKISVDGNMLVSNGQNEMLWSSNVLRIMNSTTCVQLLDSGNLKLQEINSSNNSLVPIWERFRHPTNSFLPSMIITNGKGEEALRSWKSSSDPSDGNFSASLDPQNHPEVFIGKIGSPYWRSRPWNGQVFIGVLNMRSLYLEGFTLVDNKKGPIYLTYNLMNQSFLFNLALNPDGNLVQKYWDDQKQNWEIRWSALNSKCNVYGTYGAFGSCNPKSSPICSCLRGFEPKNMKEWNARNWTDGCVRKTPLQCERSNNSLEIGKVDGFFKWENMKVPDLKEWSSINGDECRDCCLANCSCIAYAYNDFISCMIWTSYLIDMQKFSKRGINLYIRVPDSELNYNRKVKVTILATVTTGAVSAFVFTFFLCRCMIKRKASKELLLSRGERAYQVYSGVNMLLNEMKKMKLEDLQLYTFGMLVTATDNFDSSNLLGQGGFGPVYKGKMPNGQEIAVKRLSRASGQGLQEFRNKVVVISKLQHRNLVRLLGCCIEGDEKILIDIQLLDNVRVDPLTGYMSPEYAIYGRFSEKSDVYSFGILLLEIVSRRRCTSFHLDDQAWSLPGFAWESWTAETLAAFVDPVIYALSDEIAILRCTHVGLLCVQVQR